MGLEGYQVSSYDLSAPPWAFCPDIEFRGLDETPEVMGEFVWTGFDYLGEPTPYNDDITNLLNFQSDNEEERKKIEKKMKLLKDSPARSSYFGIIDLCGFPKDRFYIYQARWNPALPMAHILPHWNWSERVGEVTPVHVYTSGDEAELFLNGKSLGKKAKGAFEYRLRWDDVIYEPGELKVITYKDGNEWATETIKTTKESYQIKTVADRSQIKSDGYDLSFIRVSINDKDGHLVPKSCKHIFYEIEGPGEIIAIGNGDATSHEEFQTDNQHAYNGLSLVIIKSLKGQTGKITLKAKSDNLISSEISISSI